MNTFQKIDQWAKARHSIIIDILRIVLGIFLLIKGLMYAENTEALEALMLDVHWTFAVITIAHYVVFAHIAGGIMLALGLQTRIAALVQLPILLGAVFFINMPHAHGTIGGTELWLSFLVLLGLGAMLLFGSGKLSADNYMPKYKENDLPDTVLPTG